jgi:Zn-finger nucleic acid-binding protein
MPFREQATECVTCHVPMQQAHTSAGHELATCERCGGAWMEVADFLAELRRAQPALAVEELMEHNDGSPRRPCPRCGETMSIVWLDYLQLDQCEPHGVWFDRGELDRALRGEVVPPEVKELLKDAARRHAGRKRR